MKRDIDIEQVSDGKRYTSNDMVRLGCDDCSGCSDCCRGMGSSILLDPYDAYRLMKGPVSYTHLTLPTKRIV